MTSQKTVLITGCSDGGIGWGLAQVFAQRNLKVFATTRNVSKMASLTNVPNITLLQLDVTSSSSITAAVEAVKVETGGTLDYLVNNAALPFFSPVLDIDIDAAKKIFDINYWGTLEVIQKFSPLIIACKGTIVSIGSLSGHLNVPYLSAYASSKYAVEQLSETLRLELRPFGVKVLHVVNGAVRSNGQNAKDKDLENWKLPENSLYKPIEEHIRNNIQENDGVYGDGNKRTDTMVHAKEVVGRILAGETGRIWCGSSAGTIRVLEKVLPQGLWDMATSAGAGLDKLVAKTPT